MTDYEDIVYEEAGPAAVVRLNRPTVLNAFTGRTVREFRQAIDHAAAEPAVTGIIVTGTGRGFSAGLDAADLTDTAAAGSASRPARPARPTVSSEGEGAPPELPTLFSHLLTVDKPIIAAVNGVTAGGGMVLALMCDLRFASPAAMFTSVFSKRGLIAEHGTTWLLPRLVGISRALDLLWSSRRVEADEALRIGLVDRVVDGDRLVEEAVEYVGELKANVSLRSMAVTKRLVYRHLGMPLWDALHETDDIQYQFLDTGDVSEGVASYVERRAPRFEPVAPDGPGVELPPLTGQ